jgi:hypothetical protein
MFTSYFHTALHTTMHSPLYYMHCALFLRIIHSVHCVLTPHVTLCQNSSIHFCPRYHCTVHNSHVFYTGVLMYFNSLYDALASYSTVWSVRLPCISLVCIHNPTTKFEASKLCTQERPHSLNMLPCIVTCLYPISSYGYLITSPIGCSIIWVCCLMYPCLPIATLYHVSHHVTP